MFAQSDPAALTAMLTAAGFGPVDATPVTVTLTLGADPAQAAEYLAASRPGRALLDTISADVRPVAIDAVRAALAEHAGPGSVRLDAAIWSLQPSGGHRPSAGQAAGGPKCRGKIAGQ